MPDYGPFCEPNLQGSVTVEGDGDKVEIQVPTPISWSINFQEIVSANFIRVEGYNPYTPSESGVSKWKIKAAGPVTWYSCGYTPYLESTILGEIVPGAQILFTHPPNIYCPGSSFLNAPGSVTHQGQTFAVSNVGWVDSGFGYQLFAVSQKWTVIVYGADERVWEGTFATEPTVVHNCGDCCPNQQTMLSISSQIQSKLRQLQ